MKFRSKVIIATGVVTTALGVSMVRAQGGTCQVDTAFCFDRSAHHASETMTNINMPDVAVPVWLSKPAPQANMDIVDG